ncbi:MAG: chromate efflux transporter [Candidatus Promineofilum sp.]|nr:chromate efflux transporter [Promineifilum sp.]
MLEPQTTRPSGALREVALLFLRLGLTAFGGPAAHIAMFRDEVVTRRQWVTDAEFLDMMAAANLIPGPNSTETAIHLGFRRAGWAGLVAAGVCFILPAFVIVLAIAMLYERYGTTPAAESLLYGIEPVVVAVILQAVWGLGRTAIRPWLPGIVAVAAFGLYFVGVHELLLLAAGGVLVMLARNGRRLWGDLANRPTMLLLGLWGDLANRPTGEWLVLATQAAAVPVTLTTLFLSFLKIGSVLYGSGYVLVAFLQSEFVERLGWITSSQLLDAVAIGQFTPGPVFTTATFIGYQVAGVPGAVLATVGIFLPGFVFVAITNPFIPRMRRSPWLSALLDGVVAASLGLMAAVTVELARQSIVDVPTALLLLAAAVLLIRFRVNSTWLILGGAVVGLVLGWV